MEKAQQKLDFFDSLRGPFMGLFLLSIFWGSQMVTLLKENNRE